MRGYDPRILPDTGLCASVLMESQCVKRHAPPVAEEPLAVWGNSLRAIQALAMALKWPREFNSPSHFYLTSPLTFAGASLEREFFLIALWLQQKTKKARATLEHWRCGGDLPFEWMRCKATGATIKTRGPIKVMGTPD